MKNLLLLVVLLAISIWLGIIIEHDPGYVLLQYDVWTVEMPLWLMLGLCIVLYGLLNLLVKTLIATRNLKQSFLSWRARNKKSSALHNTIQGCIYLAEGHWQKAEDSLVRGARNDTYALLNYLGAAMAAQGRRLYQKRDDYLRLAHKNSHSDANIAIGIIQAKLQLNHGQLEQSLATLKHLQEMLPNHLHVLNLLTEIYVALKDWETLLDHLAHMQKRRLIDANEFAQQYTIAIEGLVQKLTESDASIEQWAQAQKKLQSNYRYSPRFIASYIDKLLLEGNHEMAEEYCREALKRQWHELLIQRYGQIHSQRLNKQITQAESWLKQHSHDAILLLTLGQLCIKNQLWGKAMNYLHQSIDNKPSGCAYLELGKLYAQQGEQDKSADCFEQGLKAELCISD